MKTQYKNTKNYIIAMLFIILTISITSLCACSNKENHISKSAVFFDTYITITLYEGGNLELLDECIEMCNKYEQLFSPSIESSDIAHINNSSGNATSVSDETLQIIKDSIEYSEMTDGLFDITIYPVSSLWDFRTSTPVLPDRDTINAAVKCVDYNKIELDEVSGSVTLNSPGASIDVGSIAKGYIADRIKEYLENNGVKSAIINLGGDIAIIGSKDKNTPFNIGIADPNKKENILCSAMLNNKNIATSGTYERCFEVSGTKYHHILNPHTGYPIETDIDSVSVVSSSAEKADALCTVCILMGSNRAKELIDNTSDAECLIIKNDQSVIKSKNINKYISIN